MSTSTLQEWLAFSFRQSAGENDRFAIATHRPVLPVEDPAGEEGAPAPERQHVLRQVRVEVGPLAPQLELGRRALHPPPRLLLPLSGLFRFGAQSAIVPPLPVVAASDARGGLGAAGLLLGVATGEGWKEKKERKET